MKVSRIMARWGLAAVLTGISLGAIAQPQIIVQLKDGVNPTSLVGSYPITLTDSTPNAPFALYTVLPGNDINVIEQQLLLNPNVVWADDEEATEIPESTNGKGSSVPVFGTSGLAVQFNFNGAYAENSNLLSQINWVKHPTSRQDRRIRVAILDTGLSPYQPGLWNSVDSAISTIPGDTSTFDLPLRGLRTDPTLNQAVGHGTMVAGIIGQVAPSARFVIVRVANTRGQSSSWRIIKGLAFAVNSGAELANISMGSVNRLAAMSDVLDWTETHNLQIIAPIGNDELPGARYPAGYSKAICVTGVDPADKKAEFSNWDSTADQAAPATGIVSAWWDGNMAMWSGTSFAGPLVAGALADALRFRTALTPKVIRQRIDKIGDNIDGLNPNYAGKLGPRLNCEKIRAAILK